MTNGNIIEKKREYYKKIFNQKLKIKKIQKLNLWLSTYGCTIFFLGT